LWRWRDDIVRIVACGDVGSQTYSSKAFVVPLTVTVDPALKSPPILESSHFLTWDAMAS
jgi:hypothetical protein